MSKISNSLPRRLVAAFDSPKFFRIILVLLIAQAAWIALSGRYPMAFDEDFHLGIIRLYAHHISPFWSGQPENADKFGAVARDPSYLYQYLMSFPYRLIAFLFHGQTTEVLILRGMNIGLFAGGLALYRRLLLKTGVSRRLVHFCLLIFVLVPIVPLLAAQINYDNLFLPLTALAFLMAVNFSGSLAKRKYMDVRLLTSLVVLCLLTSLVKYTFLPFFVVIFGFVLVRLIQRYRSIKVIWQNLLLGWRQLNRWTHIGLLIAVVVAAGLFAQRYAVNIVRYHVPVPDCSKVLTIEQCSEYGPWIRDYDLKLANVGGPRSPRTFAADWFYGMWLRTFFAVDGPATNFQTRGPLLLPGIEAIIFSITGALVAVVSAPKLFRKFNRPALWLFVAAIIGYIGALWLDDYEAYVRTGQPVAINGRYLLPVLLPALLIVVAAADELLKNKLATKIMLATIVVACMAWGGGALTYVLRSNDAWYWPNPVVRTANHAVQKTLGPITPGYQNTVQFLR